MLMLSRGSAYEIAFAAQMHENRGRVPRFSCFRTSVFCEVKTQIVGKTKFFDSLNSFSLSQHFPQLLYGAFFDARDLHLRHTDDAADLLLRQITRIAQTEHLPVAVGQVL